MPSNQPRGFGAHLPAAKREAFIHLAFVERRSLRESSRRAGISKTTGMGLYWDIRSQRAVGAL